MLEQQTKHPYQIKIHLLEKWKSVVWELMSIWVVFYSFLSGKLYFMLPLEDKNKENALFKILVLSIWSSCWTKSVLEISHRNFSQSLKPLFYYLWNRLFQACGDFLNTCNSIPVYHIIPFNDELNATSRACKTFPQLWNLTFSIPLFRIRHIIIGKKKEENPWVETKWQTHTERISERKGEITWDVERGENGENLQHLRVGPAN